MNELFATIPVAATPEFVLDVIRDDYRQQLNYDCEAEPDVELVLESTVAEWRLACDLVPTVQLGRALNKWWGVEIPDDKWRDVLHPAKSKTLRGVCDLIAANTSGNAIRPTTILGRECFPAAAFLTIRSILSEHGADVKELRPSTPVAGFACDHLDVFLGPISRLAPGALPDVKIHTPLDDALTTLLATLLLLLMPAIWFRQSAPGFMILVVLAILVVWGLTWLTAKRKPAHVQFGNLHTFRDLATSIANQAST